MLAVSLLPAPTLLDHAFEQWKATPEMRIEDAYKWLFHATLGGEHAVTNTDGPRRWMDREWVTLRASQKDEAEITNLTPDGSVIRVNLRPYKDSGGDKEMLLWAFVFSAERFNANKSDFIEAWNELGSALRHKPIGYLTISEWYRLDRETIPLHYPAIHHSPEYEKKYKPAYRVVLRDLWTD